MVAVKIRTYAPRNVEVKPLDPLPAKWEWAGSSIHGVELRFDVIDRNLSSHNRWQFRVRVPDRLGDQDQIVVTPIQVPPMKALDTLERRSIIFKKCNKPPFRGRLYCSVFLADPARKKNRKGVRHDQRDGLPKWFRTFRSNFARKDEVARTRGTDSGSLVCCIAPDDFQSMIQLYFALRVWILRERVTLDAN